MLIKSVNIEDGFPAQKISWRKKTKAWGAQCVEYGASRNAFTDISVRNSLIHKRVNYDLINGKIHMWDLATVLNASDLGEDLVPDKIQHYPIMNGKLNVLRGEEGGRTFDSKVIVTNPNAISEIEKAKQAEMVNRIQQVIAESSQDNDEYERRIADEARFMRLSWQDANELVANQVKNHYEMEYDFKLMFNEGITDAEACGEEMYQIYLDHGEPCVRRLDPKTVDVYRNSNSSRIEDADMIVIHNYWSKGKIIDMYGDILTDKETEYIENYKGGESHDAFLRTDGLGSVAGTIGYKKGIREDCSSYSEAIDIWDDNNQELTADDLYIPQGGISDLLPYDVEGNIKVSQVYWKSLRKIKRIKSYNPITGEVEYSLHTEDYKANKEMGEEEQSYWINQAWQGVKIGDELYVDIKPCPVQFNDIDHPSRCHFGIIGSIYNIGGDEPYSMVDIMKSYSYLYDATMDRLTRLLARFHGKVIDLDLSLIPEKWDMTEYMKILTAYGISVRDSFREGLSGAAKGKLAGLMNNASSRTIDLDMSQSISALLNILVTIEQIMGKAAGITDQREGQIQNRETVGGVERSVLQSSHITEWIFMIHDNLKKRVIECFVDMCRAAFKGSSKKFQYIIKSDLAQQIVNVDGDSFAMRSYGLVVDNSYDTQEFTKNLPTIIQAALQNDKLTLSGLMRLYNSTSRAEKQQAIEEDEQAMYQRQQQLQQQQNQSQQQIAQMEQQTKQQQMEHEAAMNAENNETKILVAEIQAQSRIQDDANGNGQMTESERANLDEKKRQFDETNKLNRERLSFDKDKAKTDAELKRRQISSRKTTNK